VSITITDIYLLVCTITDIYLLVCTITDIYLLVCTITDIYLLVCTITDTVHSRTYCDRCPTSDMSEFDMSDNRSDGDRCNKKGHKTKELSQQV
jgi:hypothetical protein